MKKLEKQHVLIWAVGILVAMVIMGIAYQNRAQIITDADIFSSQRSSPAPIEVQSDISDLASASQSLASNNLVISSRSDAVGLDQLVSLGRLDADAYFNQSNGHYSSLGSLADAYANLGLAQAKVSQYFATFDTQTAQEALWEADDLVTLAEQTELSTQIATAGSSFWVGKALADWTPTQFNSMKDSGKATLCSKVARGQKVESGPSGSLEPAGPLLKGLCDGFWAQQSRKKGGFKRPQVKAARTTVANQATRLNIPSRRPAATTTGDQGTRKTNSGWVIGYAVNKQVMPNISTVKIWAMPRKDNFSEEVWALANRGAAATSQKISLKNKPLIDELNANGNQNVVPYTACFDSLTPFQKTDANQIKPWDESANPQAPPTLQFSQLPNWNGVTSGRALAVLAVPKGNTAEDQAKKIQSKIPGFLRKNARINVGPIKVSLDGAVKAVVGGYNDIAKNNKSGKVDQNSRILALSAVISMENGKMMAGLGNPIIPLETPTGAQADVLARYNRWGLNIPFGPASIKQNAEATYPLDLVQGDGQIVKFQSQSPIAVKIPMLSASGQNGDIQFLDAQNATDQNVNGTVYPKITFINASATIEATLDRVTGIVTGSGKLSITQPLLNPGLSNKWILLPGGPTFSITFPPSDPVGAFTTNSNCVLASGSSTDNTPSPVSNAQPSSEFSQ